MWVGFVHLGGANFVPCRAGSPPCRALPLRIFWNAFRVRGFALKGELLSCLQQQESNQRNAALNAAFSRISALWPAGAELLAALARTLAPFLPAKAQKFGAALEGVWVQD